MKINPKAKLNTKQVKDNRITSKDKTKGMAEKLTRVVQERQKPKPKRSVEEMREERYRIELNNARRKNREYHLKEEARNLPHTAKAKGKAKRSM